MVAGCALVVFHILYWYVIKEMYKRVKNAALIIITSKCEKIDSLHVWKFRHHGCIKTLSIK